MRAALLLICLLAGPGHAQQTSDAGQSSATCKLQLLENGQMKLDISALDPFAPTVWVEVRTSGLPLGTVISLSVPGTDWQQSLVAFGTRSDVATLSYQVAVPRGTAENTLTLQFEVEVEVEGPTDTSPRPATSSEVLGITLLPSQ